jgi:transglutaminase-like putative cysteine protease
MRLRVLHKTAYTYDEPAHAIIQILRLTPRNHDGQRVRQWRIDLDQDAQLKLGEDAFGNIFHVLSLPRALEDLVVTVQGEVETHDTDGVVRGTLEPFPTNLFLRETPLTQPSVELRQYAGDLFAGKKPLDGLHALLAALHRDMTFDTEPTDVSTTAAQAFAARQGVCQDWSHIFIAAARSQGIPARYIGGYMFRDDVRTHQEAGHAWVEAHVEGLGWVGFDPANKISPTEAHIRVAVGLDYLGASPIRGSRYGGSQEHLSVSVAVEQADSQRQQQ